MKEDEGRCREMKFERKMRGNEGKGARKSGDGKEEKGKKRIVGETLRWRERGGAGAGVGYRLTVRKREKAGDRDKERLRVHAYVCIRARGSGRCMWGGTFEISI